MAKSVDYKLGPHTYPRGWFVVAESNELDAGPKAVRFFGQDFALYRGESGKPVMLDAYCAHMGTHIAASKSAVIVQTDRQIEGDSIRCPYHGWRYGPDGHVNDIPYHDGPCPKSTSIRSYDIRDVMGCLMVWFDPEHEGEGTAVPDYDPPFLKEWDDPNWIHWELDHLGEIAIHGQEILDNMADAQHLGPTHGAPCEFFENDFRDHLYIQRQGGIHAGYGCMLITSTWYTGPGVLLSKQNFGGITTFELIANTPIEDGLSKVWHAALAQGDANNPEDVANARQIQAGALQAFASDFDVWKHKRSAINILKMPNDGPFGIGRKWYQQFYDSKAKAASYSQQVNGLYHIDSLEKPPADAMGELEQGLDR